MGFLLINSLSQKFKKSVGLVFFVEWNMDNVEDGIVARRKVGPHLDE
jgi:hypothetical protein